MANSEYDGRLGKLRTQTGSFMILRVLTTILGTSAFPAHFTGQATLFSSLEPYGSIQPY